jgi:hypothetical protein
MVRIINRLCLLMVIGSVAAYLAPLVTKTEDVLFLIFAAGLVGLIVTGMVLSGETEND